jgi:hypothetical protein
MIKFRLHVSDVRESEVLMKTMEGHSMEEVMVEASLEVSLRVEARDEASPRDEGHASERCGSLAAMNP